MSEPLTTPQSAFKLKYTIFPDRFATKLKEGEKSWEEIVSLLKDPKEHKTKEDCPLLKLATFGDKQTTKSSYRSNENMLKIYGIEGDYDAEIISPADAAEMIRAAGITAFIYTSPSHTPEKPRWRVLAPVSCAFPVSERRHFLGLLNRVLGGILSNESFTDSQTYYFGKVKGKPYETYNISGTTVDVHSFLLEPLYPEKGRTANSGNKSSPSRPVRNEVDTIDRAAALHSVNAQTLDDLKSALHGLDLIWAEDRTRWMDVLHALASLKETPYAADVAHQLAHEFSQRSPSQYDSDYLDEKWQGIQPTSITYRSIFEWAQKDGWRNPRSTALNLAYDELEDRSDTGNSNILERLADGNLRYVPERGLWLWWDSFRWIADEHAVHAQKAALRVGEYYIQKAVELEKQLDQALCTGEKGQIEKAIASLQKWAAYCRNRRALDAMLVIASKSPRLQLSSEALDKDPWLLGVENGVVDLQTGRLRSVAREEFVTKRSPISFNPNASAPRWEQFIAEITSLPAKNGAFNERDSLAKYLQRMLGYALTGLTREHKMFVCIGEGSNGKNILLDTFQMIAGDYCQTIPPEALMASRHNSDAERPSPVTATLAGARAAVCSESKTNQRLDVALVKRHTGGGFMTARFMRENTFRFEITHKLVLMTNHRPSLDHLDDAMRGRLHLIPFDCKWNRPGHTDRDPSLPDGDKNLMDKLKEECEGILAWLVRGALAYNHAGLEAPSEVMRTTKEYFKDQDHLRNWLDTSERCAIKNGTLASQLFTLFEDYCREEGLADWYPNNQTAFSMALKARGIECEKKKDGMYYALCFSLNTSEDDG